jgi:ankyrin repeat protein
MFSEDPTIDRWLQAAACGDTAVVMEYLNSGFDINTRSQPWETALDMAVAYGQVAMIRTLLEQGAALNPDDGQRYTTLTTAIHLSNRRRWMGLSPVPNSEPLQLLLAAGAKCNLVDAVLLNDLDLVRKILEEGGDPNDGEDDYFGPVLMEAAIFGHIAMVDLLLDFGAHIEATDDLGQTSLWMAASEGHIEVVIRLLDRGANLQEAWPSRGCDRHPLLDETARRGRLEIIRHLIGRGADLHAASRYDDLTPLARAIREGDDEAASLLRQAGANQ